MKKKIVCITGGSKGIGFELVNEFINNSYFVVNFSRTSIPISIHHGKHIPCDLSKSDAVSVFKDELDAIIKDLGDIVSEWILINNAGVLDPIQPVAKIIDQQAVFDHFSINSLNPINFTTYFIAALEALKGKKMVINVGSGAANQAIEGWALYGASKAALHYFTATAALEQSREKNPVLMILFDPGKTDTSMQEKIRSTSVENFPLVQNFKNAYEKGTLNDPSLLAKKLVQKIRSGSIAQGEKISHKDLLQL